jgi:PAS domain S-box-containing protein
MEKVKVLVVEGDPVVAKDIKKRVKALGYDVPAGVSSGEQAIKKAQSLRPDLVLMAIALKGEMDGVEAAREIHVRFDIPVVYLTQFADEETLRRVQVTEPFGYILKPCDDRELRICIEMALYQHKMEEKLRASERWLSTALNSIGDAVIATDRDGLVMFMNPVAERLTGWTRKEAAGRRLPDVFRIVNQETREPAEDPASRVMREGVVVGLANHTLLVAKDGREIPIEDSGAPIKDPEGTVLGVVLVFHDVTERRQAELDLARERNLLHALMDSMPDSIYFKDTDSRFIRINQAKAERIGLCDPTEAIGKTDFDFYSAEFAQDAFEDERAILKSARPIADKVERIERPDGDARQARWVSATKAPILDDTGRVTGIVGISRDITERIRAEEALQRRVEFERVITTLSARFINLPAGEIDDAINRALQVIGELAGVDRSYIFLFYDNANKMDNTHEWCADGIEPQIQKLKGISVDSELPWFAQTIKRPEVFHVPSVADLPPEVRLEKEHFQMQNIQSLIVVPMVYRDSPIGFVGFDSVRAQKTWTEESITLLRIVADIFANALEHKRAAEALAQERNLLYALMDNIPDFIYFKDTQSRFTRMNKATAELMEFGHPGAGIGKTDFDFWPTEFARATYADEQEVMRTGQPITDKIEESVKPTGRTRWVSTTKVPIRDQEGRVTGLVGISRDITERKRAEEALAASEERFRLLAENAQDIIFRYRLIPTPGFEYVSPAIAAITGYTPEEYYADPDLVFRVIHPEDRKYHEAATRSPDSAVQPLLLRVIRKDGTFVWTEHRFVPLRDEAGTLVAIQGIARDVTERKLIEDALLRSEERFRQIVQQMPYPVEVCAPDGTAILVNPAFLDVFGVPSADQVVGKYNILRDPLIDKLGIRDEVKNAYAGQTVFIPEIVVPLERIDEQYAPTKQGTVVQEVTMFPVFEPSGGIRQVVTIWKDITERKRAEEERATFARLATRLAACQSVEEVATVVQEESSRLLGWDIQYLAVRRPTDNLFRAVSFVDTVDGQQKALLGDAWHGSDLCEPARWILNGEPALINRRPGEPVPATTGFADTGRLSASLMFAPVRSGDLVIGVLSAQSYAPDRYGESDLATLQRIADAVAPALERVHAEEERRESQARLRTAFESLPFGFWILDAEERCVMQNSISKNEWGDVVGKHPSEMGVAPDVLAKWEKDRRRALAGEFVHTEDEFVRGDEKRFYHSILAPVFDGDKIRGILGANIDVTERRRAQDALQETTQKLQALIEASPLPIVMLDVERNVRLWNPAAEHVFGWKANEVLGRPLPFVPEEKQAEFLAFFEAVRQGKVATGAEVCRRKKDGSWIDLSMSTAALRDASGRFVGAMAIYTDITERKRAEEALRQSEARFQELFDDAPVGYHELDTEGRVTRINRTELAMLGYAADELLGHPVWDFIAEADVSRQAFAAKMAGTRPPGLAFERTFRRKDGTTFPVLVSERLLHDETGRIVGIRITNQDITERKRAEEQLRESEAKFRQLADTAPVAILILRGTRFLYLNAASETITGYTREELTARETLDIVHPDFHELVRDRSMARQRGEEVPSRYEFKIVTKGGEERWLDFTAGTIQYEGTSAIIGTAYDITERKRAEEALRDALSRFESAIERTPLVAIQGVNRDGSVRHWNTASERLYGFTAGEAIGQRLQDLLLPPDDVAGFEKELADIWETGQASPAREWPVRTRQGEERYVYSAMFPVFERGAVAEVFCMDVDVTERIEAEKALHFRLGFENLIATISTNFLALALEEIDTGIHGALEAVGEFLGVDRSYIFLFSEDGKTMSNTHEWCAGGIEPQAQRLQKLPLENFQWFAQRIKRPDVVYIPRVSDLPPEASAEKEEFLLQRIQSMVNVPLLYRGSTVGFLGFDSVWAERIWREDTIALIKMVGEMFVNALERKRAQDAERHSRMITEAVAAASLRFLETGDVGTMAQIIVDQATQITGAQLGLAMDLDSNGQPRIRALSTATWDRLGVGLSDQVRQSIMEKGFFPMTLRENLVFRPISEGVSILTNAPAEHPHWAGSMPAGHPMINSFLGVPIRTGGQIMGMIALADRPGGFTDRELHEVETFANTAALALRMARSEEERKRAEDQLRQAQKMEAVGRLAGGIAHDFNNLLTAIIGYADLGSNVSHPAEHVHHCFEEIQHAATRAANLTRQLLAFSRRQPLELHLVNLNDVLMDMDKMLRRLIGEDIEMTTMPGADLGTVRVDPTQLEQVVINLVLNARDAMPEGGKLTLETSNVHLDESYAQSHAGIVRGDYVMLAVSDTGIGMSDEVKAHLFEPFFTTKQVGTGTGLGLATCYGIVKQSGGYIWAYSEPGHGTTFRIYFPLVGEKPSALPQRDQVGYLPPGAETILLVEDEEIVRTLAIHVLGDLGYTVLEAANGEQALRVLQEHAGETIHLLLTDVVMPKMGGRALAERLRTIRPDLKMLFISGYSENGMAPLTTFEPGVAFLQKPFTPGSLARKVRDVLDS